MFNLFGSPPFKHPTLGEFKRSGGHWRGTLELPVARGVPLILPGSRQAPDSKALDEAGKIVAAFPGWKPAMAGALKEHYTTLLEGSAESEDESGIPRLNLTSEESLWNHVKLIYVQVCSMDSTLVVEFGIEAAWEEEHTLGARFTAEGLVELNGSVLPP